MYSNPTAPTAQAAPRLIVGAAEIGAFLGLSERQVMHLIETGRLPVIRLGRRLAARPGSLDRWLEREEERAASSGGICCVERRAGSG